MKKHTLKSLLALAFSLICVAASAQLGFKVTQRNNQEIFQPGQRHSIALEIENNSSIYDKKIITRLILPKRWKTISPELNGVIKTNESKIIILSFFIPSNEQPGSQNLMLEILSNGGYRQPENLTINIAPVHKIGINSLASPQFVQAGEMIESTFEIVNKGNVNEEVKLKSRNNLQGPTFMTLMPDSSVVVKVCETTNVKNHFIYSLTSNLEITSVDSGISQKAYSSTKVIPNKIAQKDAWHRFPVEASIYYNSYTSPRESVSSRFYEVKGNGFLDSAKNHHLNFIVRAPNQQKLNRFGVSDQYSFIYMYLNKTTVYLGDHTFNANKLGYTGRYSAGMRIDHNIKDWRLSAFYSKPRLFYDSKKPTFGGKISYYISKYMDVGLSVTNSEEVTQFTNYRSINIEGKPGQIGTFEINYADPKTTVESEVATSVVGGTIDYASDLMVSHRIGKFYYNGHITTAGENYFGAYNNSFRYSNNLNYNLAKWRLSVGQNYSKIHERRDTTFYGARPYFENYYASIGYQLNKRHYFSIRVDKRKRKDQSEFNRFNYKEKGIEYRYRFSYDLITMSLNGRVSLTDNLRRDFNYKRANYAQVVNFNYKYNKELSLTGNFSFNRTNRYTEDIQDYYRVGGGFNLRFNGHLKLSATYNSGFSPEENYRKRDFVNASMTARITEKHRLEARVNYYMNPNAIRDKEVFAYLKYTFKFGAPLKKILKQGGINGRFYSSDPSINLRGIQVVSPGSVVRSNSNGEFELNNIPTGSSYLLLDESSMPMNIVPVIKMPLNVEINEDENIPLEIELVKAVLITGRLEVDQTQEKYNLEGYLKLENADRTYFAQSDQNGAFRFEQIVPGDYKLSLIRLKNDSKLTPVTEPINVKTSDNQGILKFKLKAKERKINFKKNNFNTGQ